MLNIGEFARQGRVSARMLRHYDALGLLTPAHVDASTGYRLYAAGQLSRLNRIVALKELGFSLPQVRSILDEAVSGEQLRGMLRLRRVELAEQIAVDNARLTQVEARLAIIEREGAMPTNDVQIKRIPAIRVAQLTATADSFEPESIGPVLSPLYPQLFGQLAAAGLTPTGPHLAYYTSAGAGDAVVAHACVPVDAQPSPDHPFAIVDLPAIEQAATIIHHGPMDGVVATIQTLSQWIELNGYRSSGYNRELYLLYGHGDPADWTTELQEPIVAS